MDGCSAWKHLRRSPALLKRRRWCDAFKCHHADVDSVRPFVITTKYQKISHSGSKAFFWLSSFVVLIHHAWPCVCGWRRDTVNYFIKLTRIKTTSTDCIQLDVAYTATKWIKRHKSPGANPYLCINSQHDEIKPIIHAAAQRLGSLSNSNPSLICEKKQRMIERGKKKWNMHEIVDHFSSLLPSAGLSPIPPPLFECEKRLPATNVLLSERGSAKDFNKSRETTNSIHLWPL